MWEIELDENGYTESPFVNEMLDRGARDAHRETIVECLHDHFPESAGADWEDTVNVEQSLSLLRRWSRAAIRLKKFRDLEEVLRQE